MELILSVTVVKKAFVETYHSRILSNYSWATVFHTLLRAADKIGLDVIWNPAVIWQRYTGVTLFAVPSVRNLAIINKDRNVEEI